MILCVNPNASIDKTVVVDHFQVNSIHRPSFELSLPGGKGINVARAAHTLGQQVVVTGWTGGHAGQFIEQGLHAEGIRTAMVHLKAKSRTCLSIIDPHLKTTTEIYEQGKPISDKDLETFYDLFRHWLPRAEMVTLSGSLPPGVPVDFYARLIRMAREAGVPAGLDASGEPLQVGLSEGRPYLLKCNRAELSEMVGEPLAELGDLVQVTRRLSDQWGTLVIVTLAAAGAVASENGSRTWLAQSPKIEAASAVGAGDAVMAGLVSALANRRSFEEALRLGMAAGAANTLLLGAGRLRKEDVDALEKDVRVAITAP